MNILFSIQASTYLCVRSLHDALPISTSRARRSRSTIRGATVRLSSGPPRARRRATTSTPCPVSGPSVPPSIDRKSTRLNSSHVSISYAVFGLKKIHGQLYHVHQFSLV